MIGRVMGKRADREHRANQTALLTANFGLGLPPDHLDKLFGERRSSLVKLIHYPRHHPAKQASTPITTPAFSPCSGSTVWAGCKR